ncbi:cation channel sperm-associated auxiliary subunit epsilon isoform X2 [Ascaphus truei]
MTCPVAGKHTVGPWTTAAAEFEDSLRYLTVSYDLNCFMWYIKTPTEIRQNSTHKLQDLYIWLFDPENADPTELNNTAASIPQNSKVLSQQFWILGQNPVVQTFVRSTRYKSTKNLAGGWKVTVPLMSDDIITTIIGEALTFQDCFVIETPYILPTFTDPLPYNLMYLSISLPSGSETLIVWSACFPTTAVLLTDFGSFQTDDGFVTSKEIKLPQNILSSNMTNNVTNVALTDEGIVFLIGGKLFKIKSDTIFSLGTTYNLPDSGISGIQSRTWCASEFPKQNGKSLSILLLWTENELYLGYEDNVFMMLVRAEQLQNNLNIQAKSIIILTVAFGSRPPEVGVLISTCIICDGSDGLFWLAIFDEHKGFWVSTYLKKAMSGFLSMKFFNAALPDLLMWSQTDVFYSYHNNTLHGMLKTSETNNSVSSSGSTIQQVIIDYFGNAIIKMKNNDIFFLKVQMKNILQLHAWQTQSSNMIFYLNPTGDLFVILVTNSGVSRQYYPLTMEVLSSTHILRETCEYRVFQHSISSSVYFLDMGNKVSFWAQLVYKEDQCLFTEVCNYLPSLLFMTTSLQYEIASGICTKNLTMTFYHKKDYSSSENYTAALIATSGSTTIELLPNYAGRTCSLPAKRVTHIFVGCPPSRRIVIDRPTNLLCKVHNFTTYKIPGSYLRNPIDGQMIQNYNWQKYGCLLKVHYKKAFIPTISLYDGDTFVKPVDANFIVWEIHGRNDYSFNTTMDQAGCLREAQTWKSMIDLHKHTTLDDVWGPKSYQTCFVITPGILGDLSQPYEILNRTSNNSITWPQDHIGIYVFTVKILDPNFSFCDLRATFAIETFGIIERPHAKIIPALVFTLLFLFVIILLASYFKYVQIFRALRFTDPHLNIYEQPKQPLEDKKKEQ